MPSTQLLLLALLAVPQPGYPQAGAAAKPDENPAFEVISVKPNNSGDPSSYLDTPNFKNVTPRTLIEYAYNVPAEQCSGGPPWIDSEHYDVAGKMSDSDYQQYGKLGARQQEIQRRLMLQALLSERFGLKVGHLPKEINAYALVVAKGGPKIQPTGSPELPVSIPGCAKGCLMTGDDQKATVGGLADTLSRVLGRTVVDDTGLKGTYRIKYVVPLLTEADQEETNAAIRQAMREQLGLKVEPRRITADAILVEHIEHPSPN